MKILKQILIIPIIALLLLQCKDKKEEITPEFKPIIGFNQNWSFLPKLHPTLFSNINMLKAEMIRYPGGSITHKWDWKNGIKYRSTNSEPHTIIDIKSLVDATHVKMIFVLDILNKSIEDQILMLNSIQNLGIPINYIELGNELYANDSLFIASFPTGVEYALKANIWLDSLKIQFPKAKIAAVLQGRRLVNNSMRLNNWNSDVINTIHPSVDAFTYHVYIPNLGSFKERKIEFDQVVAANPIGNKEIWITEYGFQSLNTGNDYLLTLDSLADYIENFPKVTIALNHNLIGLHLNKLTSDGYSFTNRRTIIFRT